MTRGVARRRASLATGAVRWSRSRDSLAITPRDSLAYGSTVFKAPVVHLAEVLAICLSLSNIVGQEMTAVDGSPTILREMFERYLVAMTVVHYT